MAYSANQQPLGLTVLTVLENNDTFVVGDTSDTSEVVKSITKAALITDLSSSFATAAQMATKTYKGRTTAGTGNAEDVAVATLKTDLILVKADVGLGNVDNTSNATERAATRTVTNMRVNSRSSSSTTASTLTPDLSVANFFYRTTQTATLTINAPTGTPVTTESIVIEVNSVAAQTLTINAAFIPFGAAFPATTIAGKAFLLTSHFNGTRWITTWAHEV